MRLPAILLLAATLLFWGFYDRYEPSGPKLLDNPALTDAASVRGDCSEDNGHFVLKVVDGGKTASINFRMPDAVNHTMLRVRGRMKVDGVVEGPNSWRCGRLLLVQYDGKNKWIPGHHGIIAERGTKDWDLYEDVFEIDPRAQHADMVIQQTGTAGTAEFDRLAVEPVRIRPSFMRWRICFATLWICMGVLYFRRCRLHKRKLRILILLNAIAILFGTLMPETWIEDTAEYARLEMAKTLEKPAPSQPSSVPAKKPSVQPASPKQNTETVLMEQFDEMVGKAHGIGHFCLFATLCFLVYWSAALERQERSYYAKVAFDVLLFAAVTESLQYLTIDRTAGVLDWLKDLYGMFLALVLFVVVQTGRWFFSKLLRRPVRSV